MAKYGAPPQRSAVVVRPTMRLDKWLWQARFFKTRSLATAEVAEGHMRVNSARVAKPAHPVSTGDTLTFALGGRIRLIRVLALAGRRGSGPEAQQLYLDLDAAPGAASPLE